MSLNNKQLISIYIILNGLGSIVPTILCIGFAIALFEKDVSGVSVAYSEPAMLLGAGCAGLMGGAFFKRFSSYAIGLGALLCAITILLGLWWYNEITIYTAIITYWMLSCIMSIEHANSLAFISRQLSDRSKPFVFSTFQILLRCFNIIAPIGTKYLLASYGFKWLILLCMLIYLLRILSWILLHRLGQRVKDNDVQPPYGIFTGMKAIMQDTDLLRITSYRMINCMAIAAYMISLPILIAKLAKGDGQLHAQIYSYNLSFSNLGFILGGIYGSWSLKTRPKSIIYFCNIGPMLIVIAAIVAFYVSNAVYLHITALLHGIGLYLLRTATAIIAQALTQQDKLMHVILAGDAIVKFFSYGISALIPLCIGCPPIWGVISPLVGSALVSCFSLGITKSIIKSYLASSMQRK